VHVHGFSIPFLFLLKKFKGKNIIKTTITTLSNNCAHFFYLQLPLRQKEMTPTARHTVSSPSKTYIHEMTKDKDIQLQV
jgi:hypothetical protein